MAKDTIIIHAPDAYQCGFTRFHHAMYALKTEFGKQAGVVFETHQRPVQDGELLKYVQSVVIQRPVGPEANILVRYYSGLRQKYMFNIVYDLDDNLWEYREDYAKDLKAIANVPNFIVCSTRRLAKEWKTISSRPAIVLPNAVPGYTCGRIHMPVTKDFGDGNIPKVFYGGSIGHDDDFSQEWIDFLTEEISNGRMEFHAMVAPSFLEPIKDKLILHKYESPISFLTAVNAINPDFYIAPLEASTFNYCKSDLKLKEAAALGCVFVGSDIPDGPYNYAGKEMLVNGNIREVFENLYKAGNYNAARLKLRQMYEDKGWNVHNANHLTRFIRAYANGQE